MTNEQLWGGETNKAVDNFPVSGETFPAPVVRGSVASRPRPRAPTPNSGCSTRLADRIAAAGDSVANGEHDDQFPIDVFQLVRYVVEHERQRGDRQHRRRGVHPNDAREHGAVVHDVFPSAVHLAAVAEVTDHLLPALSSLADSFSRKLMSRDVVKSGRTHLMDAVPVTLGRSSLVTRRR